jgi:hypothetical protein
VIANESDIASANNSMKTMMLVADIFKKYRAKLQLTAEEKKLIELKTVIERSIRDTQYAFLFLSLFSFLSPFPLPSTSTFPFVLLLVCVPISVSYLCSMAISDFPCLGTE